MKKIIIIFWSAAFMLTFSSCFGNDSSLTENVLTLDKVRKLAEKGNELSWSDFDQYDYEDIGSGLYIRVYKVDEDYRLVVGGVSLNEQPMYIHFLAAGSESFIDIRTEDLDAYINDEKEQP